MVLSGITERTRELLRVTALDIKVWPIYDTKRGSNGSLAAGLIPEPPWSASDLLRRHSRSREVSEVVVDRSLKLAADMKTNARTVDRFGGEPDDELTGRGRASGSFSAVSHRTYSRSARAEPPWASTTASITVAKREGPLGSAVSRLSASRSSGSTSASFCSTN